MVELNGELSNQIFHIFEEWEMALQGLSKDISLGTPMPGF